MKRKIVKSLRDASQTKIEQWLQNISQAIATKGIDVEAYNQKKQELLPKLIEAQQKGIAVRELSKITGISRATISRWVNEQKDYVKEAQEMVAKAEAETHAKT